MLVQGRNSAPRLVKANKLVKGFKSDQQIYVVKLNKVEEPRENKDPTWLHEFSDIFPEELTNLPPSREIDHEIKLIPRSEPV